MNMEILLRAAQPRTSAGTLCLDTIAGLAWSPLQVGLEAFARIRARRGVQSLIVERLQILSRGADGPDELLRLAEIVKIMSRPVPPRF
jgi:hypothetical protein